MRLVHEKSVVGKNSVPKGFLLPCESFFFAPLIFPERNGLTVHEIFEARRD